MDTAKSVKSWIRLSDWKIIAKLEDVTRERFSEINSIRKGMGLLQRDKDGCWKRPQEEKTGGAYRGLWVVLRSRLTAGNGGGGGVSARGRDRQGAGPPTGSQPPHLPPHPIPQPLARHPAYLLPPPSSVLVLTCPYPCRPGCAPTVRSPLPEHTYIWQIPQKTQPLRGLAS